MGIFDKIKGGVLGLFNKDFMKAICGACALIAYADGEVTPNEIEKMKGYMSLDESLKNFAMADVMAEFENCCQSIGYDINIGRAKCFENILLVKQNNKQCETLVSVAIAIAKSDSSDMLNKSPIDNSELSEIKKIADRLGVNLNRFDC